MNQSFLNPKEIATRGEQIYEEKYKKKYEKEHGGKFLAINVETGEAFLGNTAQSSFKLAKKKNPSGIFHLIKIGALGAYRVSYTSNDRSDWIFS
ncbi:hypothetical protein MYX78_10895 [Acidobacteria bacterium AH-259-G07]|nr:hypothetical protein [Acidobacteria bacterium AH-259-G07]